MIHTPLAIPRRNRRHALPPRNPDPQPRQIHPKLLMDRPRPHTPMLHIRGLHLAHHTHRKHLMQQHSPEGRGLRRAAVDQMCDPANAVRRAVGVEADFAVPDDVVHDRVLEVRRGEVLGEEVGLDELAALAADQEPTFRAGCVRGDHDVVFGGLEVAGHEPGEEDGEELRRCVGEADGAGCGVAEGVGEEIRFGGQTELGHVELAFLGPDYGCDVSGFETVPGEASDWHI